MWLNQADSCRWRFAGVSLALTIACKVPTTTGAAFQLRFGGWATRHGARSYSPTRLRTIGSHAAPRRDLF